MKTAQDVLVDQNVAQKIKEIGIDEKHEMIIKSRWSCDSYWMMFMVLNAGWDLANKTNMEVGEKLGLVEMRRLLKATNLQPPKNPDEFMVLLKLGMEMFLTKDYFDYQFIPSDSGISTAVINQCYANTQLRKIGAEKEYKCACFNVRGGWYQALNLEVKETLRKCLIKGDDCCEILIEDIDFHAE